MRGLGLDKQMGGCFKGKIFGCWLISVLFLGLPAAPKFFFGSLYFPIFGLACACLIEIILFNSK